MGPKKQATGTNDREKRVEEQRKQVEEQVERSKTKKEQEESIRLEKAERAYEGKQKITNKNKK